jgi:hypothetical protein
VNAPGRVFDDPGGTKPFRAFLKLTWGDRGSFRSIRVKPTRIAKAILGLNRTMLGDPGRASVIGEGLPEETGRTPSLRSAPVRRFRATS